MNLISAGVGLHRWSLARDLIDGPAPVGDDSLRQAYTLAAMVGSFPVLSPAATGVVFLIWFHRVRTNGQVFRPDGFSQSSGRAIGAWFVPLGNVCLPYRIAKETWRAGVRRAAASSHPQVSTAPVTAWWLGWVLSTLCDSAVEQLYKRADTPEGLAVASSSGAFSDLLTVAAAVLAVVFVRRLTAPQHARVMGPPTDR
ncbi:DUF4328 domain-containing protein [Streptomyces sp. NPDC127112]|uniref:DUF4328 domain-containing protein n=1 Tax=Streptomyces sp. NPDC127112 TaxID=3345364 RepID=UPI0036357720